MKKRTPPVASPNELAIQVGANLDTIVKLFTVEIAALTRRVAELERTVLLS